MEAEKATQGSSLSYDEAKEEALRSLVLVRKMAAGQMVPDFVGRSDNHKVDAEGRLTAKYRRYENTFNVEFFHSTGTELKYSFYRAEAACSS